MKMRILSIFLLVHSQVREKYETGKRKMFLHNDKTSAITLEVNGLKNRRHILCIGNMLKRKIPQKEYPTDV